jgi:hypothetical protein
MTLIFGIFQQKTYMKKMNFRHLVGASSFLPLEHQFSNEDTGMYTLLHSFGGALFSLIMALSELSHRFFLPLW